MASEDNQYDTSLRYPSLVNDILNTGNERLDWEGNLTSRSHIASTGWYKLVRSYTSRNITFMSDILPGLSGLASEVQKITGARYLAGLWDCNTNPDTFIRNLLWLVADDPIVKDKAATLALNGSPSWSWASVHAEIDFRDGEPSKLLRNPDINPRVYLKDTTLATSNPLGQVKEGFIHLVGYVHSYTGPETFSEMREQNQVKNTSNPIDYDKKLEKYKEVCVNDDYCYIARGSEAVGDNSNDDFAAEEIHDPRAELRFSTHFLNRFVLDIPDLEYDWTSTEHLILFMGLWCDEDQWFLLLRSADNGGNHFIRVGIAQVIEPYLFNIDEKEGWSEKNLFLV